MVLADLESFIETAGRAAKDWENKKEYFKMINLGIRDAKRGFFGNIKDREKWIG